MAKKRIFCVACQKNGIGSKEHVFPDWLINRTKTHLTGIKWVNGSDVNPKNATLPLCARCNKDFGSTLESPVSQLFNRIESGKGLNDFEAELIIKWIWKIQKMFVLHNYKGSKIRLKGTLRDLLLKPIGKPRERLTLCIGIFEDNEGYVDLPMGLDIETYFSGILCGGVFSRLAIIVTHSNFIQDIPYQYTKHTLEKKRGAKDEFNYILPIVEFKNGTEAVGVTKITCQDLLIHHENQTLKQLLSLGIDKLKKSSRNYFRF